MTLNFSIAHSTSKALGSDTSGSALCISVCLTSITPCTFSSLEKWFLHLAKILWASVTKSLFSSFFYISSRLLTLHNVIDAPVKVPGFFTLLFVSSSSILAFRYAFLFLKCLLARLYCSDHLHWFGVDGILTAF